MDLGIRGKTAIVGAAGTDLGQAAALALAQAEVEVTLTEADEAKAGEVGARIQDSTGSSVTTVVCDITTQAGRTAALAACPAPATGGCMFFNPFSSNFAPRPGEALHNSPALRPYIVGDYFGDGRSQLTTLEANVTGFLLWRNAGYAAGAEERELHLMLLCSTQRVGFSAPRAQPGTRSAAGRGLPFRSAPGALSSFSSC